MPTSRDIDVALLRAFVAVAETGRMIRAARVVGRSQGAVSQQILRLEALFGVTLFDRRADAVRLTADGERLMARAHRLISLNDQVMNEMREVPFVGEVRLGVPPDIVAMLMPPILRAFSQAYPNVLVTLVSATSDVLAGQLERRDVDLAILTEAARGGQGEHLLTDRLTWVGARGGEAFRKRPLSVALGPEQSGFRQAAVKALTNAGVDWRPICQVGSLEPVFATLEADMAVAVFLSRTVPDWLEPVAVEHLPPLPPFHVNLRLPAAGSEPVAAAIAQHIRDGFLRRYG